MTTPKLVPNPPQGSGLISSIVDKHWQHLTQQGVAGDLIAAAVLLQPVGTSQRRTKDGVHRTVTYEVVRLEPILDAGDADTLTWQITRAYEARTGRGEQTELPLDGIDERRAELLEALQDWAKENEVDAEGLSEKWTSHFGGPEHTNTTDPAKGSYLQLLQFTRAMGVVKDPGSAAETSDVPAVEFSGEGDDDDTDPDAEL